MTKKRFFPALLLTLVLALSPLSAFAESGAYAVKFYPGDYGTMTKNDQIPFVYYGIDDDVNKPYYYKLNVSETETLSFAGSIIDTLLPNSGYEFAYWTANAAVYQAGSGTAIPAGTPLSSDQIQNSVNVRSDNVIFTAQFKQISENPDDSEIATVEIVGATLSYKPGETPRATAAVAAANQGRYRIADEWWQELNENDEPVAIWHSDGGAYSTLPTITAFESGKKYVYSVLLMPEREYNFAREVAATVNGNAVTAVPATDGYLSLPNVKTITPTGQITPPATGGYYYSPSTPTITALLTAKDAKSATDYSGGIYGLTFRSTASFSSFRRVQVDGKTLDKSNYIAEEGSIEVYLKAVYLQTLAAGKHTVTILSTEGDATAEFTIGGSNASPKTTDPGVALYAAAALLSTAGLAWISKRRGQ